MLYRLLPSLCALSAFVAMTMLYAFGSRELYASVLEQWGIHPFRFPFLDFQNSLAAWECTRQGIDVIETNPCDALGRGYTYGPMWLAFSFIPLGGGDTAWVGWILGACFLASISSLPPTQRPWELLTMIAASLSTMVVFAVERANADVIVFMLAVATGHLALSRSRPTRFVSYGLIGVAGLLKYYPITMFLIALRERWSAFIATATIASIAGAFFVAAYHDELQRGIPLIVTGSYYTDLIAAKNLPFGLVGLSPWKNAPWAPTIVYAYVVAAELFVCSLLVRKQSVSAPLAVLGEPERVFLIMGCAIMVGCFFAGQSDGYRGIALLLTLPGFIALARTAGTRPRRRLLLLTTSAVVFLMWEEYFRLALGRSAFDVFSQESDATYKILSVYWVVRELVWWWVITVMVAVLIAFIARSEALEVLMPRNTLLLNLRNKTRA